MSNEPDVIYVKKILYDGTIKIFDNGPQATVEGFKDFIKDDQAEKLNLVFDDGKIEEWRKRH